MHNTFETENMRAKYHQFEAFIQRVSKVLSKELDYFKKQTKLEPRIGEDDFLAAHHAVHYAFNLAVYHVPSLP